MRHNHANSTAHHNTGRRNSRRQQGFPRTRPLGRRPHPLYKGGLARGSLSAFRPGNLFSLPSPKVHQRSGGDIMNWIPSLAASIPPPHYIVGPERALWDITDPDGSDRRFRHEIFRHIPDAFASAVATRYREHYETQGLRVANLELLRVKGELTPNRLRLAADDDANCFAADRFVVLCCVCFL